MRTYKLYIWMAQLILCILIFDTSAIAQTSVGKYSSDLHYDGTNANVRDTLRYNNVTIQSAYTGDENKPALVFATTSIKLRPKGTTTKSTIQPGSNSGIQMKPTAASDGILYFSASDNEKYGQVILTWTNKLPDYLNRIRIFRRSFDENHNPVEDFLLADFPENKNGIDQTSFTDSGFTYIDKNNEITESEVGLTGGVTYEYCLQAYNSTSVYNEYDETTFFTDAGKTMYFGLMSSQYQSDAYSNVSWKIDANCLKSPSGNDVYFVVKDYTNNKIVYDQVIMSRDVDAFLAANKYSSEFQLNFDNANGHIDISALNSKYHRATWTNEFWIRLENTAKTLGRDMYLLHSNAGPRVFIDKADNTLKIFDGNRVKSFNYALNTTDTWYHLAFVSSSDSKLDLYVDGEKKGRVNASPEWDFSKAFGDGAGHAVSAAISEWRIWSEVRTSQEVMYNHRYERTGNEETLLAYFKLDAITGNNLPVDLSATHAHAGLNATKVNSEWSYFESNAIHNRTFDYSISEFLGPDRRRDYTLNIYDYSFGDPVCSSLSSTAITTPYVQGRMNDVTTNDPGKITLSWSTPSDLDKVFKIYRKEASASAYKYLATVNEAYTYEDCFEFNNAKCPQVGTNYDYKVTIYSDELNKELDVATGRGRLYNYSISAHALNDTVIINLPNFLGDGEMSIRCDSLKLYRDGEFIEYITTRDIFNGNQSARYCWPKFGSIETYEVRLLQNGKEYSGVSDTSFIAPNGIISGYVCTRNENYCVPNAEVTVSVLVKDKTYTYPAVTNNVGYFEVSNVYYGYGANVTLSAKYGKHELEPEKPSYTLDGRNRGLKNIVIYDNSGFEAKEQEDYLYPEVFKAYTSAQTANISWVYNHKEDNLLFNVYRHSTNDVYTSVNDLEYLVTLDQSGGLEFNEEEGEFFGIPLSENDLKYLSEPFIGTYRDTTVQPGEKYIYHVIAYRPFRKSSKLNYQEAKKRINIPMLSNLSGINIAQNPNASISLSVNTVKNDKEYDGLVVYRNGKHMGSTKTGSQVFTDSYGVPGENTTYSIKTYTLNNGKDSAYSNLISAQTVYPELIAPSGVIAAANSANVSVGVSWDYNTEKQTYNFDGFEVLRREPGSTEWTVLNRVAKNSPNEYTDQSGSAFGEGHEYGIRAFRLNNPKKQTDTVYSDIAATNASYPAAPLTTLSRNNDIMTSLDLSWDYDHGFQDGFRLSIEDACLENGLTCAHYNAVTNSVHEMDNRQPTGHIIVSNFQNGGMNPNSGFIYEGYIKIETAGDYTFYTSSDDGSKLYINGEEVVNNDGVHGTIERNGTRRLAPGYLPIRLSYFQGMYGQSLTVSYSGPGISKRQIPDAVLFRRCHNHSGPLAVTEVELPPSTRKYHNIPAHTVDKLYHVHLQVKKDDSYTNVASLFNQEVQFTNALENPARFTASEGIYKDYIRLSWEYPLYIKPTFRIYRDGVLVDTVGHFKRTYYDYDSTLEPGKEYKYHIVAELRRSETDIRMSDPIYAFGSVSSPYFIGGKVLTHNQYEGIKNVDITVRFQAYGKTTHVKTLTDANGEFRFDNLPMDRNRSAGITVSAYHPDHRFDNVSADIEPEGEGTMVKLIDKLSHNTSGSTNRLKVSEILSVSGIARENQENVKVSWMTESENYTSFLVYRNEQLIAKIDDNNTFEYTDRTAMPGYIYNYGVAAMLSTPYEQDTSATTKALYSVKYPGYATIDQIDIVEQIDSNRIELYWGYTGKVDFFEIYRLYKLIGVVKAGENTSFLDTTGVPGLEYNYTIKGYNKTTRKYTRGYTASARFPYLTTPQNLEARSLISENKVRLSWEYTAPYVDGFFIMRNNEPLTYVEDTASSFVLIDTSGLPETIHEYQVMAYRQNDYDKYYSEAATDTAYFPHIEPVSNFTAGNNGNHVLQISWQYPSNYNIGGFYLYGRENGKGLDYSKIAELDASQLSYTFENGIPNTRYDFYIVAFTNRGNDKKEYTSSVRKTTATFPQYPAFNSLTCTSPDINLVELRWNYNWEYCDGFVLKRNGAAIDTLTSSATRYIDHISREENYALYSYRVINGKVHLTTRPVTSSTTPQGQSGTQKLDYFTASDGTYMDQVKLKWKYLGSTNTHPAQVAIYRKSYANPEKPYTLLDVLNKTYTSYMDDDVEEGAKYIYKVVPQDANGNAFALYTATGHSKIMGTLTGGVKTYETQYPVEGATIKIKGRQNSTEPYTTFTTVTGKNGNYTINGIDIPEEGITYTVAASYDNHIFVNNNQEVLLEKDKRGGLAKDILDLNGKYISGKVYNEFSNCGQKGVKITLLYLDARDTTLQTETVRTNDDGSYKFGIRKVMNTTKYAVIADTYHENSNTNSSNPTAYWHFAANTDSVAFPIDEVNPIKEGVNFADTTHYSLNLKVKNTCGYALPNHKFVIAVQSTDNSYYKEYETNFAGKLNVKLAPANYSIRVIDANPLDLSSKLYIDYFRTRSKQIPYQGKYENYVFNNGNFNYDTTVSFIFHKTPEIKILNTVGEELSDVCNFREAPGFYIAKTDSSYKNIQVQVIEEFDGEECPVQSGYVVITNDGASGTFSEGAYEEAYNSHVFVDTVNTNGTVEYGFIGGAPLPVYPYLQSFKVEYFAELNPSPEFLAERVEPILTLGVKSLEGKDVLVNPTEDDNKNEVLLPMFVLRDPPGDQSYSYIEKGTTIKKSFSFNKGRKATEYGNGHVSIPLAVINLISDHSWEHGAQFNNNFNLDVTYEFKEKLETSKKPLLSTTHETSMQQHYADIIGGVGLAYQVSVGKGIDIIETEEEETCAIVEYHANTINWDGVNTQWTYTLGVIDDKLKDLDDKIDNLQTQIDNLNMSDELLQKKQEDAGKLKSVRDNWLSILKMYSTQSLPHYDVCRIIYDQNRLKKTSPVSSENLSGACSFCNQFFKFDPNKTRDTIQVASGFKDDPNSYIDGSLEINWVPSQLDAYNSALDDISGILFSTDPEQDPMNATNDWYTTNFEGWKNLSNNPSNSDLKELSYGIVGMYTSAGSDWGDNKEITDIKDTLKSQLIKAKVRNETFVAGTGITRETNTKWFGSRSYKINAFSGGKGSVGVDAFYEIKTFKVDNKSGIKHNTPYASVGFEAKFVTESYFKLAARLKASVGASHQYSYTESESSTFGNSQKFGYYFNDDDYLDEYSVMIFDPTRSGYSPYFQVFGGYSMCPYEKGTINRSQIYTSMVVPEVKGDDTVNVTYNNIQYDVDHKKPAVFKFSVSNGATRANDGRLVKIYMAHNSNSKGADIKIGQTRLSSTKGEEIYIREGESQVAEVKVWARMPNFNYEDLNLVVRASCESSPFVGDTIPLKVYFRKPCSPVTVFEPNTDWKINKAPEGKQEVLPVTLTDFYAENKYFSLDSIILQYKRGGADKWYDIGTVTADSLVRFEKEYGNIYPVPTYPMVWDITNDASVVDGTYILRAMAEGGKSGYTYSNTVKGKIDRASMAVFGSPQPEADGVLRTGEDILVTFNDNIDCQVMDTSLFSVETLSGTKVNFSVRCSGGKLYFDIEDTALEAIHGDTLKITIADVKDLAGNGMAEPFSWSFRVNCSPVTFTEDYVQISMNRNSTHDFETKVTSAVEQITRFSLSGWDASWVQVYDDKGLPVTNGKSMLFNDGKRNISLQFNSNNKSAGTYFDTLYANMDGHISAKTVFEVTILPDPVGWSVDLSDYNMSMNVIADLKVDDIQITDTNDVVAAVINNTVRGVARFRKIGGHHLLYMNVWGNDGDINDTIEFRYWDASTGMEYNAKADSVATFAIDRVYGSSVEAHHLTVESAENRVRYIHFDKGWNMFSLNALPENPTFNAVFNGMDLTDGDLLKGHNNQSMAQYSAEAGKWITFSDVDTITPGEGYWIYLGKANALRFSGNEERIRNGFNLFEANGWFLIGSPVQSRQNINGSMKFNTGSASSAVIKSVDGVAEYTHKKWIGSLEEIRPFRAYKIKANAPDILTFLEGEGISTYPQSNNKYLKSAKASSFAYEVKPSDYEHNATIIGEVIGVSDYSENDKVVAFDKYGSVRGIGNVTYVPEVNRHMVSMYVYAEQDEQLTFSFCPGETKKEFDISNELTFRINDRIGSVSEPYGFMVHNTNIEEAEIAETGMSLHVYPNPFAGQVNLDMVLDQASNVEISVYDVLQQKLVSTNMELTEGKHSINLVETLQLNRFINQGAFIIEVRTADKLETIKVVRTGK